VFVLAPNSGIDFKSIELFKLLILSFLLNRLFILFLKKYDTIAIIIRIIKTNTETTPQNGTKTKKK
jgi:hypothetical protein